MSLSLLRVLAGPGYSGQQPVEDILLQSGRDRLRIRLSGRTDTEHILVLSPGFGGALKDYGPLVRLFETRFRVARLTHSGSSRSSFLLALGRLLWVKFRRKMSWPQAFGSVREWIHRPKNCQRRLRHVQDAYLELNRRYPTASFSAAGHSFGTDTVLRLSLQQTLECLYLFSPHPPDYLIPGDDYKKVLADKIWVVVGSQDITRDGVGPGDRLKVAKKLPRAESIMLPGVAHMDFAFQGRGPDGWERDLASKLGF